MMKPIPLLSIPSNHAENGNGVQFETEDLKPGITPYVPTTCLLIEAVFHLLTVIVYVITWGKHNVYGKILCSCALALFLRALLMGVSNLPRFVENPDKTTNCFLIGVATHYFTIASFTWLLLINFENWWTFSFIRLNGSAGRIRFLIYSLNGWGFPILIVGVSLTLNFMHQFSTFIQPPDYGKVNCFVAPSSQGHYVHGILFILFAISIIFGAMTLKSQYNYRRETDQIRVTKRVRTIFLFVKLSAVMGLTLACGIIKWILTKRERLDKLGWLWTSFDVYNALSGFLIFIIFVCRGTILNHLGDTHPLFRVLLPTRTFQLVEQR